MFDHKIRWARALLTASWCGVLPGCGTEPPKGDETDLVLSIEGRTADYQTERAFFVVPRIVELCEQADDDDKVVTVPAGPTCADFSDVPSETLLEYTVAELQGRGHVRTEDIEDADWILTLGIVSRQLWDLGEEACFALDDFSGCSAPLTGQDVQIPTGSLVIYLFDATVSRDAGLVSEWIGAVDQRHTSGKVLGMGGAGDEATIEPWLAGITQAFEQSPGFGEKE